MRGMTLLQTIKIKANKNFQPLSQDEKDEFYQNGAFVFNITKLQRFIKANPHTFQAEEVSVASVKTFFSSNFNEATIQVANIAEPILLAEIAPDRFNVIDGNHRLERAYRDGASKILAYKVPAE